MAEADREHDDADPDRDPLRKNGGAAGDASDAAFVLACLAIGAAFFALAQFALPGQFFESDDFTFLVDVQRPDWSWREAFFPLDTWSYWNVRPLGVDAYFRICSQLFGVDPWGFFQVNLAVHFAVAPVVYALSRQLGLGRAASAAAALLCISRPPSLRLLYYGAGFASLFAQLLIAAAVACHLAWSRSGRSRWLAGELCLLLLALLSHEIAYFTPAVLFAASLFARRGEALRSSIGRGLRDVAPALALALPYLAVRFTLFAPLRSDAGYARVYDAGHVLRHLRTQLEMLFGEPWVLWTGMLACCVIAAFALRGNAMLRAAARDVAPRVAFCAVWAGVSLAPILLLPYPHVRYSHYAEVPAALAAACFLDLAVRALRPPARQGLLVAAAIALGFAVPWASLGAAADAGGRPPAARFRAEVDARVDPVPQGARFVVLYGAEPLAPASVKDAFVRQVRSGTTFVRALYFARDPVLAFQDVRDPWTADWICDACIHLDMHPDASFHVLDEAARTARVFGPALESENRALQMAAARQLAREVGLGALPRLQAACDRHASPAACRTRVAMAVAQSGADEATPLLRALRGEPRATAQDESAGASSITR